MRPRPDLRAFVKTLAVAPSSVMTYGRKRRGSLAHGRYGDGYIIAEASPARRAGRPQRASNHPPRRRKLSPEQEAAICVRGTGRTLRELAAESGISHETVRAVWRRGPVV